MDKSIPLKDAEAAKPYRAHPLRTGKIRLSAKASASEIARSVGVRPSEAKVALKALHAVESKARKSVAPKSVVTRKNR